MKNTKYLQSESFYKNDIRDHFSNFLKQLMITSHYVSIFTNILFNFFFFVDRYLSKTVSSYFPTQVTDVFTQGRDFTTAVLPITGYSPISVITTIQRSLK